MTDITGTLPSSWGQMRKLVGLDVVNFPGLTGSLPSEWASMTSLETLRVTYTQISGEIPPELGQLTSLKELGLHKNRLVGAMPEEICSLRTSFVLGTLQADCKAREDGDDPAQVQCELDVCCTFCSASFCTSDEGVEC